MSMKGATELTQTQSEDALNSRKDSRKKLSVEGERISSILKNCISQVEIAAALSTVLQSGRMSSAVDKELSKALQEHQILCERLETLEGLKQDSGVEQGGEGRKRARAELEEDIKNSFRDLLRYFRGHPDAIIGLRSVQGMEVDQSECQLIRGLKVYHSHTIDKLLISPDEELLSVFNKQVTSSPVHDPEGLVSEEEKLDADMKKIDGLISQKQNEITNLQDSLQEKTAEDVGMSPLADKQCQSHIKTSKKQASLQEKIDQLNIQLNNLILENRQAERMIQEKNKILRDNTEYLIQCFDSEMEKVQRDLEENECENEKEEEELQRLEKSFSVLKVEYDQIQERRWLAEEKRKEEMRMLELKTKASVIIQAWWRGYSVRKGLKNKEKIKAAKKSKGKK